jgi:hypothetical protein
MTYEALNESFCPKTATEVLREQEALIDAKAAQERRERRQEMQYRGQPETLLRVAGEIQVRPSPGGDIYTLDLSLTNKDGHHAHRMQVSHHALLEGKEVLMDLFLQRMAEELLDTVRRRTSSKLNERFSVPLRWNLTPQLAREQWQASLQRTSPGDCGAPERDRTSCERSCSE